MLTWRGDIGGCATNQVGASEGESSQRGCGEDDSVHLVVGDGVVLACSDCDVVLECGLPVSLAMYRCLEASDGCITIVDVAVRKEAKQREWKCSRMCRREGSSGTGFIATHDVTSIKHSKSFWHPSLNGRSRLRNVAHWQDARLGSMSRKRRMLSSSITGAFNSQRHKCAARSNVG